MRAFLALLLAGAILSGCGGGGSGTSTQTVLPPIGPIGARGPLSETPLSASAFGDAIGVNTHMSYVVGGYNTDFARWAPVLKASGIKHVRDGVCPTFVAVAWCIGTLAPRMNELASAGITFDLVTSMNDPFSYVAAYANTLGIASAIEAYEGPNECDVSTDCPRNWPAAEPQWQEELYALKAPGVTIVAPSMTSAQGYSALGDISAYADAGNIHDFPAADEPESSFATQLHLQWAAYMTGGDPVWCTEDGYNTDPTYANNGVPQVVQERYLPRILFEHLRLGVMRTYIYQLFDFGPDGGSNMGLLSANYTPKPAWTRLSQLMQFFADSTAATQTPLAYAITGDTSGTLDHVLFERSDGTYLLALWLARPVYDPGTRSVLPIAQENVTVSVPASTASAALTAFGDNGAVATSTLTGTTGTFTLPVRSTVSVLQFRP